MSGLLYPAYQKFYSALSNLERFNKESNFFDNISAIDSFFTEYRNITFVIQSSLKHTEFFDSYEKNRVKFLTDHWFVDKRNETIKQKPFELTKEIKITLYLPFGGITISEKKYSVENDESLESIFSELKKMLCEVDPNEVCFSVSFAFHEANSDVDLLERVIRGIDSMKKFMDAMERDIGEHCQLCDQLKDKIKNIHFADVPADFLLINDYTYYPQTDFFDRAERGALILSLGDKKVISHRPVTWLTKADIYNHDGTVFGNFTKMHAFLRVIQPGGDIIPAILVVYGDGTFDLDAFYADMKTTMYRKIAEVSRLIEQQDVVEVCYMSLYAITQASEEFPLTSRERLKQSKQDILVCASIDKHLQEKEYIFDGKRMEDIEYVASTMENEMKNKLSFSVINLSPIKRAFENKAKTQEN